MTDIATDSGSELPGNVSTLELDAMFDWLERMPAPEGFKVEIVEGALFMVPTRHVHWQIILGIATAFSDAYGERYGILSDVRIDFPGHLNGFAPDIAKLRHGATSDAEGRLAARDVEFVAEVISKATTANDYGPKKTAYATAGVPVYLIVDPYSRRCHLHTGPQQGTYAAELTVSFGTVLDLAAVRPGLTLPTGDFPHD